MKMGGKRPGGNNGSISRREDYIPSDDNPPPTEHRSREDYITSNDKPPPADQHHFSQFW